MNDHEPGWMVTCRREGDVISIENGRILIEVITTKNALVRLAIKAPKDVPIDSRFRLGDAAQPGDDTR